MGPAYDAPHVDDYGSLVEVTSAVHLLLGHAAATDLSFSSPGVAGGGNSPFEAGRLGAGAGTPTAFTGTGHHVAVPGGAESGGGVAGGSGGGPAGSGGQLPFTGFAAAGAAALGTGLAAVGSELRRRLRRRA